MDGGLAPSIHTKEDDESLLASAFQTEGLYESRNLSFGVHTNKWSVPCIHTNEQPTHSPIKTRNDGLLSHKNQNIPIDKWQIAML